MQGEWWVAGNNWLIQRATTMAQHQKGRYNPPQWHRDAVDALGRNDEEAFKRIKLDNL